MLIKTFNISYYKIISKGELAGLRLEWSVASGHLLVISCRRRAKTKNSYLTISRGRGLYRPDLIFELSSTLAVDGQEHPATAPLLANLRVFQRCGSASDTYIRERPGRGAQTLKSQIAVLDGDRVMHVSME